MSKLEEEIAQIRRKIEGVEEEIAQISREIKGVEEEITLLPSLFKKEELREEKWELRKKEQQLRNTEEQLRKKEERFCKKEEQLLLRFTTGSGKSTFTTEVSQLLTSLPPFPLDGDRAPTAVELSEFLMDFSCLEGKVPTLRQSLVSSKSFYFSTSELAALTTVVVGEPLKGEGEMVANYRLIRYVEFLMHLQEVAPSEHQLKVYLGMDNAVPESSTQSARCRKRKRPDAFLKSVSSLLLYVEGKKEVSAMGVAEKELSNMVPDWVFGKLQFTLAVAVAGSAVQVLMKRPSSKAVPVMKRFDLYIQADRVTLLLVFIKMYSVMLSMARVGDAEEPRTLTFFVKHQRPHNSCVELDGEGCLKTIEKWSQFSSDFGVKLKDVQAAYTAAAAVDQLVKAEVSPKVTGDKYMVLTRLLGYSAEYKVKSEASKEEACKKLARDVLHALDGLHGANLVHRDVRLANVIWCPEKLCYVLIDLETVAAAGVDMRGDPWTDYTPETLKRSRYQRTSDLHQLGVLLERLSPAGAKGFVGRLKGHCSSAKHLLKDAWLN